MKKSFVLSIGVCFVWLLIVSTAAWAITVTSIGEGETRQAAINNALRAAVEQGIGSYLQSNTKVAAGKLDYDRIITSSAGYIRNYNILTEGKDPVEAVYKVKIKADLDDYKLKNLIKEFKKDPRFQKTFQKATFDNRRVVVIYKKRTANALPANSMAAKEIVDLVGDKLRSYSFRVFLPNQLKRIKNRNLELSLDEETAIQIARQENGDAVVLVDVAAGSRRTPDGYWIINTTLGLKAYDVTTGELFANVTRRNNTISRRGDYAIAEGAARAVDKAGQNACDELVAKIVKRFSNKRENFVVFTFKDTSAATQDSIYKVMQNLGWNFQVDKQYGTYLEIEVFSEADPTAMNFSFRRGMRNNAMSLKQVEMKGSQIVYSGQ